MKKNIFLLIVTICTYTVAFAQADKQAKALLDVVSEKYDAYRTIQADFSFSVQQTQSQPYTDKGTLFLKKTNNQFRIELGEQDIISDGKSTWSILKEDREAQISATADNAENIGPNNLFTFYKEGFRYKSLSKEKDGEKWLDVVELIPTDNKTNYAKIKLRINENKHIHDVIISDKSGTLYRYTIHTLYVNHQIPTTKFTFVESDYPGYEVVDLR